MRERFLAGNSFRGRERGKLQYAILAAAAIGGGAAPNLLDEVVRRQTDDFWQYATPCTRRWCSSAWRRTGQACRPPRCAGNWGTPARPAGPGRHEIARTWLPIRVDLIKGHGERLWPRPGRIFAAARSHTFSRTSHCRTGAGATSPTGTGAAGTATTAKQPCRPTPPWPLSRPYGRSGDPTAHARAQDSCRPRQADPDRTTANPFGCYEHAPLCHLAPPTRPRIAE